jgi:hypothetical protein
MVARAENSSLSRDELDLHIMDAAFDATFMKNIVDYFCKMKSVTPQWVRNSHACNKGMLRLYLRWGNGEHYRRARSVYAAAVKVLDLLLSGKSGMLFAPANLQRF